MNKKERPILKDIYGTYSVIKKEWDWLEISKKAGNGVGVNGLMSCNFIDGWMFEEILQIRFEGSGKEGVLIEFDRNGFSKRQGQEPIKQTKVEIIKSILINFFNASLVKDVGLKYFLEGYDIKQFFDEWVSRVYGKNFVKNVKDKKYKIYVDEKLSYIWLDSLYFMGKVGLSSKIGHCGFFDVVENKVKFSLWSDGTVWSESVPGKYISLFGGVDVWGKGVYMCEFDGSLEEFGSVCEFLE